MVTGQMKGSFFSQIQFDENLTAIKSRNDTTPIMPAIKQSLAKEFYLLKKCEINLKKYC